MKFFPKPKPGKMYYCLFGKFIIRVPSFMKRRFLRKGFYLMGEHGPIAKFQTFGAKRQ